MRSSSVLAFVTSIPAALAVSQGFNYGSVNSDGSFRFQADFEREFKLAQSLPGASGFNSARLYTMIQGGSSTNEPIQAIPAAISTSTTLLLGLWGSGGDGFLQAEITALKTAISQYGSAFTDLVVGISVGSEDLYRISPTGIAANSGYGAEPATIAKYIAQVREAVRGTPLSGAPIGHVDTWTAWVNGSNQAVIDACDWIGNDAYPYFQNTQANSIGNGESLFNQAMADTQAAVGNKEVWITETGWPVSGSTQNQAVPNTQNAKTYWDEVGCPRFGNVNIWWFTLQDATPTTPNPSFGLVGSSSNTPLFDLSCDDTSSSTTSSRAATSAQSSAVSTATGGSGSSVTTSASTTTAPASSTESVASTTITSTAAETSAEPSAASSIASSVAAQPPVSSGGGLSPSQGVPPIRPSSENGSATATGSGPFPTNANASVIVSQPSTALTIATTVVTASSPGSSPSSTGPETIDNGNDAATLSSSFFGAIGAFVVLFMVL